MSRIARQSLCSFINTQSCKTQTEDSMPSLSREPASVAWVGNHLLAVSWVEIRVLGPCSWTPQFLNSSILQFVKSTRQVVKSTRNSSIPQFFKSSSPQETSRASASPADPDAYINGALISQTRRIYQLVHLFTVMSSMCSVTGSTYIYLVYSPSCLEKISHATTRRENPRTLDW